MFGPDWALSERQYGVRHAQLFIPLADGNFLDAELTLPDSDEPFPVLLCVHAYDKRDQFMELHPTSFSHTRGQMEAGSGQFFARRGYVHVVMNVRGTGNSTGTYDNLGQQTIDDICEAIEWLAAQQFSNGKVGMFGISYFAIVQPRVAMQAPDALKALFAPYGYTDMYRDRYYHGGILSYKFMRMWLPSLHKPRLQSELSQALDESQFESLRSKTLEDNELTSIDFLKHALANPDLPESKLICDILMQPLDGQYYRDRSVDYDKDCTVPAYFGACWGTFGLHLPGAMRSFNGWNGPRKMTIGPPVYLDRPFYQYQLEALRWFDHWLKDNDTGILDEPDINLFVVGTGEWLQSSHWPLPQTRFTRFYLHEGGELSEREYARSEGATAFEDSPYKRAGIEFWTSKIVELTTLAGPVALELYADSSDDEALWFISVLHETADGEVSLLTRGWLRGSQRHLDTEKSTPYQPYHTHDRREPLTPGEIYKFDIEIRPYAIALKPGEKLGIKISCSDEEEAPDSLHVISMGHLARPAASRIQVHHNAEHPSNLILPVVSGNRIGTFVSGGKL